MNRTEQAQVGADTKVRVSPSVYARAFGSELVLLDFGRGEYFGLDELGARIWTSLEAGTALAAIVDDVVASHEVGKDDAFRDIVDLVTHMRDQGLVVLEP